MKPPKTDRGFTLIELMIAVAVIGALAAAALPSFASYLQRARTVEAVEGLARVAAGAKAYFQVHGRFPNKSKGFAPRMNHNRACRRHSGVFPAVRVKKDFSVQPWTTLLFYPGPNPRYRYRFLVRQPKKLRRGRRRPGRAYVDALGDLDCDRIYSHWRITLLESSAEPGTLQRLSPYLLKGSATE